MNFMRRHAACRYGSESSRWSIEVFAGSRRPQRLSAIRNYSDVMRQVIFEQPVATHFVKVLQGVAVLSLTMVTQEIPQLGLMFSEFVSYVDVRFRVDGRKHGV